MFKGTITAIITPFADGKVDLKSFKRIVKTQIEAGIDGIVIAGTTGESPNLDGAEIAEMFAVADSLRKEAASNMKIIVGTGSNSTAAAVKKTEEAKKLNPDGMLVVTPYYNKPNPEGQYLHFAAVAKAASPCPVILYNVPGRTGCNMQYRTVERLAAIDNIVSLKEASGSVSQISEIYAKVCAGSPKRFTVLSGDDGLTLPILAVGGAGVISVTSNVAPALVKKCVDRYLSGDTVAARETHDSLMDLHEAMFLEANPIPVKAALSMMGLCKEEYRLPLAPMAAAAREKLSEVLKRYGLIA